MSYLTPYYPYTIKAFLEARPALAALIDGVGFIFLIYLPVGLLILWRLKFYRPKPPRAKEPKPKGFFSELGLKSKLLLFAFYIPGFLFVLALIVIVVVILGGLAHSILTGQWLGEVAFVLGLFAFSCFCLWLIGR
jgi:hypothetical protein